MDPSQKTALLDAITAQGTLNKACTALKLDRRAVSRVRQDDARFNAQVLAALAAARLAQHERGEPDTEDGDEDEPTGPAVASPVPPPAPPVPEAHEVPNQSLINVPGQREPLPGHERAAQRVGLPPSAPPISGEEPKGQETPAALPPYTYPPGPAFAAPVGSESVQPRYDVVAPVPPADLYPPRRGLRDFSPDVIEAAHVFLDTLRADPVYARNLQVRLAVAEGGDNRPLGTLIAAAMKGQP